MPVLIDQKKEFDSVFLLNINSSWLNTLTKEKNKLVTVVEKWDLTRSKLKSKMIRGARFRDCNNGLLVPFPIQRCSVKLVNTICIVYFISNLPFEYSCNVCCCSPMFFSLFFFWYFSWLWYIMMDFSFVLAFQIPSSGPSRCGRTSRRGP